MTVFSIARHARSLWNILTSRSPYLDHRPTTAGVWMKSLRLLLTIVLISIIGTGCGLLNSPVGPTETAVATLEPTPPGGAYPAPYPVLPTGAIPYPSSQTELGSGQAQGVLIYPGMNDGDTIDWDLVSGLVYAGYVSKIVQTHDLKVYLTLKDGRTFLTAEPAIDEIIKMIEACGETCEDVRLATE